MAIKKRPVSPRQKMINLMYVVLMAMLALNVSNEVLNGFSIVEESLKRTEAHHDQRHQGESGHIRRLCRTDEEEPAEGSAVVRQVATGQGDEQQALQVGRRTESGHRPRG